MSRKDVLDGFNMRCESIQQYVMEATKNSTDDRTITSVNYALVKLQECAMWFNMAMGGKE